MIAVMPCFLFVELNQHFSSLFAVVIEGSDQCHQTAGPNAEIPSVIAA
jgi:hypothetical protein